MNIYEMLHKIADGQTSAQDAKAMHEVITSLDKINAFGAAARTVESETDATEHVHISEQRWSLSHAGWYQKVCAECGINLGPPYEPTYTYGQGMR